MEQKAQGQAVVLWVSRHPPLPCQLEFLRQRIGPFKVEMLIGHIPNAEYVINEAKKRGAKYVLPVLPLSFTARLVELCKQEGCVVLWSKMKTIASTHSPEEAARIVAERPDCRSAVSYADGVTRVYEFETIERIIEVKLVTEPL